MKQAKEITENTELAAGKIDKPRFRVNSSSGAA